MLRRLTGVTFEWECILNKHLTLTMPSISKRKLIFPPADRQSALEKIERFSRQISGIKNMASKFWSHNILCNSKTSLETAENCALDVKLYVSHLGLQCNNGTSVKIKPDESSDHLTKVSTVPTVCNNQQGWRQSDWTPGWSRTLLWPLICSLSERPQPAVPHDLKRVKRTLKTNGEPKTYNFAILVKNVVDLC